MVITLIYRGCQWDMRSGEYDMTAWNRIRRAVTDFFATGATVALATSGLT
ncbi:hypothetical protein JOC45_000185 [Gordonia hydrophobica]|nr:hypothetical protein [Gordonia hydrophobica]